MATSRAHKLSTQTHTHSYVCVQQTADTLPNESGPQWAIDLKRPRTDNLLTRSSPLAVYLATNYRTLGKQIKLVYLSFNKS